MRFEQILEEARESITVRRVFGEPYESGGVTFVPVARVSGGAGGGVGTESDREGSGGGFGMIARPVGAYEIRDGQVRWVPAFDATRVILLGQVVGIVALLVVRAAVGRIRRR